MSKFSIISEFWAYLKVRKKWWLAPIVFFMLLLGLIIVLTQGSAIAPFIYTLFLKNIYEQIIKRHIMRKYFLVIGLFLLSNSLRSQPLNSEKIMFEPLSYEKSAAMADSVLAKMSLEEKIDLVGGDRSFFIRAIPRLNIPEIYMADATQGVHLRNSFGDNDLSAYQPEKSSAFPSPIALASTWNTALSYKYAEAIGEECRYGGIGVLLGPGMNIYRQAQCGRNFEYFGEDPLLAASMIEQYIRGVQSTGTIGTLKHFVANNTDYFRRKSNSIVDQRTLHEIYLPAFKAGVDAGAKAVMTSYNLLNGEWCGQSSEVINGLLREQLGFKWLVMTDWWSVWDGEKLAKSGQDLEMPHAVAFEKIDELLTSGKVTEEQINRMAKSIITTMLSMRFNDREKLTAPDDMYDKHVEIALQTAREGIVLLKNENNILPLKKSVKRILLTGDYVDNIAHGGGAATVKGFDNRMMLDELKAAFGSNLTYIEKPTVEEIKTADIVLCNIGTFDSEGWDRPFELSKDQEEKVLSCVNNNPNAIVIVNSGSGIRMTDWADKAKAILYAWYPGQMGNKALAEIISGKVNPSGKLPITIEKNFKDSPGYGYVPEGEELYHGWNDEMEREREVYDLDYKEGVFVGYRWYEKKKIEPLFSFGHGLSYTQFDYDDLKISSKKFSADDIISVTLKVKNSGNLAGMETVQLYITDLKSSVERPLKELKAFQKVELQPGESKEITMKLCKEAFSFWNPETQGWYAEKGKFVIKIGSSSQDIKLEKEIELK